MNQCKQHGLYACDKCMLVRKEVTAHAMTRYVNATQDMHPSTDGPWILHSDHEAALEAAVLAERQRFETSQAPREDIARRLLMATPNVK